MPIKSFLQSVFKHSGNRGFTVLELMMVSAIMAALLALFLANFHGFENRTTLESEADKLVSVLKQAQILSLTGQTVGSTRYNYGVHLAECPSGSCRYILFVDLNNDNYYESGEEYNQGSFEMPAGVFIKNNNLIVGSSGVSALDIIFEAPSGNIFFNDSQADETAQIILTHAYFNGSKTITLNRVSGQINAQ